MRLLSDQTIRIRATVVVMMVTAFLAVLAYAALLALVRYQVADRINGELAFTARQVATLARAGRLTTPLVSGNPGLIQVQNDQGKVVSASRSLVGLSALHAKKPAADESLRQRVCPGERRRCFTAVALRVNGPVEPLTVYVLAPEPGIFPRPVLAVVLALGIPAGIGAAGAVRWWFAGRQLRPVERILAELNEINSADLQRRLSEPDRRDEYHWLVTSINATLDRLEATVEQQRRLVSDVSHDLRSPITGLRAELEAALLDPEGTNLRSALAKTLKNTERLQNIVTELLVLARREAGLPGRSERVDLAELAEREVARRPRRVTAKVVSEENVVARVNNLDVGRILTNLLDNAARHADSEVVVTVRRQGGDAIIDVFNDGDEIAPADRERIFDRFTRLPASTERDSGGTGLGLAISREIAGTYGGTLAVADGDCGARFVLTLPLLQESEA